jgi:hypothetical protein
MSKKTFSSLLSCIFFSFICVSAYAYDETSVKILVQKGDNLINLGEKYLEDPHKWREVAKFNRIQNPDLIYPGQVVLFPLSLLKGVPSYGAVSFIKGNVEFQSEGSKEWRTLFLNDRVEVGTGIRTGDDSAVEIAFEDGHSSFLQSSNTTLGLSAAQKKEGNHTIYKLFLKTGRAITKLKGATGRESRFEIETPSSICAVRGTVFRTAVDSTDSTRSEVLKGIVDVEAMHQTAKVQEGEGTLVRKGEPPMKPKKLLPPAELMNFMPIYKTSPLHFEFRGVEGAVSNRVMFAKDSDFKDILKEQIIKPSEPFKIYDVDDGTYFLQS